MASSITHCDLLLVDDDSTFRETLALVLRFEGVGVRTAEDGRAALERLRDGTRLPDLILTDLVMPRLGGWGLIDEVRADAQLHSIPIVVLTGSEPSSDRARDAGVFDVLQKPFDLGSVLRIVARHCAGGA